MAVRSWGPDTILGYVYNVTLTLEIWPWVTVMIHPWVMDNNCVKYYPDPTWQWRVMARTWILKHVYTVTLTLKIWPWVIVMAHPWFIDNDCEKYYPYPTRKWGVMARTWILKHVYTVTLTLKIWPLGESNDTFLGHGQQLCEILSRSDTGVRSYGPDKMWTDRQGDSYIPAKICLQGV